MCVCVCVCVCVYYIYIHICIHIYIYIKTVGCSSVDKAFLNFCVIPLNKISDASSCNKQQQNFRGLKK